MSETKHTPGPWEFDSGKDGGSRYQIINGQLPKGINGDFGYPVADTMNRHHCIAPEEDEANARLIAAAPELLEALRQMVLLFDDAREGCLLLARADHKPMTNGDQEVIDKAFIAAEAAIRKAKGE